MTDLLDYTHTLLESDVRLQTSVFPSGNRDFTLTRIVDGEAVALSPLELLKLERAVNLIEQEENEAKALNLALCRLLVPSIRTSHVGRHLVVEPWSTAVVRGETLPEETRTEFAQELSREQADTWRIVRAGDYTIKDPLENVFWDAVTDLPFLERQFEDPILGKFGRALYFQIVPPGKGRMELKASEPWAIVKKCKENDFSDLKLSLSARESQKLFRKYLAVTVRWTSKMTGQIAHQLVKELCNDERPLTPAEKTLLNLRYGAAEPFGKINVGFLFGCNSLFITFFNNIFRSIANDELPVEQDKAISDLLQFVFLYRNYQWLRKYARLQEKQERRDHYWDNLPGRGNGSRVELDDRIEPPDGEPSPFDRAVESDSLRLMKELVIPELEDSRPKQAKLLKLYIECDCNLKVAAQKSHMTERRFHRHLQETILPSAARVARRLGLANLSDT